MKSGYYKYVKILTMNMLFDYKLADYWQLLHSVQTGQTKVCTVAATEKTAAWIRGEQHRQRTPLKQDSTPEQSLRKTATALANATARAINLRHGQFDGM